MSKSLFLAAAMLTLVMLSSGAMAASYELLVCPVSLSEYVYAGCLKSVNATVILGPVGTGNYTVAVPTVIRPGPFCTNYYCANFSAEEGNHTVTAILTNYTTFSSYENVSGYNVINAWMTLISATTTTSTIPSQGVNQTFLDPVFPINATEWQAAGYGYLLPFFSVFFLATMFLIVVVAGAAMVGGAVGGGAATLGLLIVFSVLGIYPIWVAMLIGLGVAAFVAKLVMGAVSK